jgi:formate hydrogenlyase subunit 6/NADH:ubiquinone oxidoreductase subunit I
MSLFSMTGTVLRNLFSRPATRRYPRPLREAHRVTGTRGSIAIDIDACIFCGACAKRCPTDAIVVTKPDRDWTIDRLRCCTCNACVEVCPKKCLVMDVRYTPPTATRDRDSFRQAPPTSLS